MTAELEKVVQELKTRDWGTMKPAAKNILIRRQFTLYRCELEDLHLQVGIYHKPITYNRVVCARLPKFANAISDEALAKAQGELDDMYRQQDALIASTAIL